ncbi:hypothetical protein HYV56_01475 [Candidatus Peregrinibacteria bacterium]|nr:hypothetical protein [Candidatus Peregrinibacteria bacterium]
MEYKIYQEGPDEGERTKYYAAFQLPFPWKNGSIYSKLPLVGNFHVNDRQEKTFLTFIDSFQGTREEFERRLAEILKNL